jgi:site-specific recombinase XerD
MKPTDLSVHVTNFLTRYLAGQRNLSPNTIKAYRDVFTLLLRFGRDGRGIAVERLCLADIHVAFVEAFLDHLAQERHCSIRTQNQRLAVLHAFFRYVQSEVPDRMLQCQKIMAMPLRRHIQLPVAYMSKDELTQVLAHPDPTTPAGRPARRGNAQRAVRHRRQSPGVDRPERPRCAADDTGPGQAAGQGAQGPRGAADGRHGAIAA